MSLDCFAEFSTWGRLYDLGNTLYIVLRKIALDIIDKVGDFVTGLFPRGFSLIASENKVKYDTVWKIWKDLLQGIVTDNSNEKS